MAEQKRLHAVVHGRVQGVSFRYYTQQTAQKLNIVGWVRNNSDGTVEVTAEDSVEQLQQFLDFLHQGSPAAKVEKVDVIWSDARGEFSEFRVTYQTGLA